MSRNKQGSKTGRREHLARQAALREAKKRRKARAARFAHLPGQQAENLPAFRSARQTRPLHGLTVTTLRKLAREAGCEVRDRHRKAELIAMIEAKYEAIS